MNAWSALTVLGCVAAAVVLIITGHDGWIITLGLILFMLYL